MSKASEDKIWGSFSLYLLDRELFARLPHALVKISTVLKYLYAFLPHDIIGINKYHHKKVTI